MLKPMFQTLMPCHIKSQKRTTAKQCNLFDSHADFGYGGLLSLDFEVNCSNWLGKLLKEKQIEQAHIIYSP
jgi:hypothetical protein